MLELNELSLINGSGDNEHVVLHEISAQFPEGQFTAILGPSASGNLALLALIAGTVKASMGGLKWNGPDHSSLRQISFIPSEPERRRSGDLTQDYLTARERINDAINLRLTQLNAEERQEFNDSILLEVGLANAADKQARFLSSEQKCRLKLGVELVSNPRLLLCENIAEDLDPRAETEILQLLRQISTEHKCLTLLVTGNLRHFELFDSLVILQEGHLAYHGSAEFLFHYFNIQNPEGLFPRLAQRKASEWHNSWGKHRDAYYSAQTDGYQVIKSSEEEPEDADLDEDSDDKPAKKRRSSGKEPPLRPVAAADVSTLTQLGVLLSRHCKTFFRNRARLLLQLALILGLPCIVVIFGWDGLFKIANPTPSSGTLVSGLAMFQAILLAFAGMINGASAIVGERALLENEKFAGLRPLSYIASKAVYLAGLAAVQSLWMVFFVKRICHFPGSLLAQSAILFCVTAAMTAICLGISALCRSTEKARLATLFLVAIQLPLSGTILALPALLSRIVRPLDTAYWGWAGYLQTFGDHYDLGETIYYLPSCRWACTSIGVLLVQILLGLGIAWMGAKRNDWKRS